MQANPLMRKKEDMKAGFSLGASLSKLDQQQWEFLRERYTQMWQQLEAKAERDEDHTRLMTNMADATSAADCKPKLPLAASPIVEDGASSTKTAAATNSAINAAIARRKKLGTRNKDRTAFQKRRAAIHPSQCKSTVAQCEPNQMAISHSGQLATRTD